MLRLPSLLITMLLLTACQSAVYQNQFYPPASGEDSAELVFSSDDLAVQPLICLPGSGWRPTAEAVGRGDSKVFDDLNKVLRKAREVTVRVPAGEIQAGFRYRESGRYADHSRCQVDGAFSAQAGERIQLLFRRDDGGQCLLEARRTNTATAGTATAGTDADSTDVESTTTPITPDAANCK